MSIPLLSFFRTPARLVWLALVLTHTSWAYINPSYSFETTGTQPLSAFQSTPYQGTPVALPGVIQAENYDLGGEGVAYHDADPSNKSGQYRQEGVDIETCQDASGGHNLAWSVTGEWVNYTVNATKTAEYQFDVRVASPIGGVFHLEFDGQDKTGSVNVPNTGGWQNWQTVTKTVNLTAGQHVMRFVIDRQEFNTNSFSMKLTNEGGNPTGPIANGTYRLTCLRSNKSMDVARSSGTEGADVWQYSYVAKANQQFKLEKLDSSYYRLIALHSGKSLGIAAESTQPGAHLIQTTYTGKASQQFSIEALGNNLYRLRNRRSKLYLDVNERSLNNQAYIVQQVWKGEDNQQWKIEKIATYPTIGHIERLDPELDAVISPSAQLEVIANGFGWIEGPLWLPSQNKLLFSDNFNNRVVSWSEVEGTKTYVTPSGYTSSVPRGGETGSNGLLLDTQGRLVLCQHGNRQMARMDAPLSSPKPVYVSIASRYDGKRFNSPNDGVYTTQGNLYFTDPPYGLERGMDDPAKELPYQGVYKVDPNGVVTLLTKELSRPNGLAFSPDEKTLYVANSDGERAIWMAYTVLADGTLANGRVFYDVTGNPEPGSPDGMKVNKQGYLFASGPGGIWIFTPAGKVLGKIRTGQTTPNCAFNADQSVLYIMSSPNVVRLKLKGTPTARQAPALLTEAIASSVSMYPNPTNGSVTLQAAHWVGQTVVVTVVDAYGKTQEVKFSQRGSEVVLVTAGLKLGVYSVIVRSAEGTVTKPLVVGSY